MSNRKMFLKNIAALPAIFFAPGIDGIKAGESHVISDPTKCNYAPPGEYIKDHTIIFHDGWYHLFSISGTQGYYHGYNGNEETISWSISRDLVNWEFRGHVLHASQRKGTFDQHEIWAPFCIKANGKFYMFYTGIIHPTRPMEYRKLGHDHPWVFKGHKETQGLAISTDLTDWEKVSGFEKGLEIPGRDSFVLNDLPNNRYLLYSTIGSFNVNLAVSNDLMNWKSLGECAKFPETFIRKNIDAGGKIVRVAETNNAESLNVIRHPLNSNQYLMLANNQYILSDDPLHFEGIIAKEYDLLYNGKIVDIGFAGETLQYNNKWYRSGVFGKRDYWTLGFTEIQWIAGESFKVMKPGVITN